MRFCYMYFNGLVQLTKAKLSLYSLFEYKNSNLKMHVAKVYDVK